MYNWSTDEKELKQDPERYKVWRLEQLTNYGLGDEKLNQEELKRYLPKLSLDPARRRFLELLLHEK